MSLAGYSLPRSMLMSLFPPSMNITLTNLVHSSPYITKSFTSLFPFLSVFLLSSLLFFHLNIFPPSSPTLVHFLSLTCFLLLTMYISYISYLRSWAFEGSGQEGDTVMVMPNQANITRTGHHVSRTPANSLNSELRPGPHRVASAGLRTFPASCITYRTPTRHLALPSITFISLTSSLHIPHGHCPNPLIYCSSLYLSPQFKIALLLPTSVFSLLVRTA